MIAIIADHPTPKFEVGGGICFTLNGRDYKGAMVVAYTEKRYGYYTEDDAAISLRASSATCGGQ